jgi:hypothetical protein
LPKGYTYISMAGASGDRWAIRIHPSFPVAGAADATGDVAATTAAVLASRVVIIAIRARLRRCSRMATYLSSQ